MGEKFSRINSIVIVHTIVAIIVMLSYENLIILENV